jgi:hypothetical protein
MVHGARSPNVINMAGKINLRITSLDYRNRFDMIISHWKIISAA